MSHPSITNIKAGIALMMALGFVTMHGTNVTTSAVARTGNDQDPAIQEESPFDQKQALADLRKKIAGQEDTGPG